MFRHSDGNLDRPGFLPNLGALVLWSGVRSGAVWSFGGAVLRLHTWRVGMGTYSCITPCEVGKPL